jgi:hypothetical protein
MDLQICYKGYVLKIEIIRMTGYKDRFRLKGLCREVGFEFFSEMDENALDRLKERFREQVDYYLEESYALKLSELIKLLETNPKAVERVLESLTIKERDNTSLLEVALFYVKAKDVSPEKVLVINRLNKYIENKGEK